MANGSDAYAEYQYRPDFVPTHYFIFPRIIELLRLYSPGKTVVDIGCGNGMLCELLQKNGYAAHGVEMSEQGLRQAAARIGPEFLRKASANDDASVVFNRQFNAVLSVEVIEHLYDPMSHLLSMYRSLQPGGVCIITTPYHGYVKNCAIALSGKFDNHVSPWWTGGHIKFWSFASLQREVARAGFSLVCLEGIGKGIRAIPYFWSNMICVAQRKE